SLHDALPILCPVLLVHRAAQRSPARVVALLQSPPTPLRPRRPVTSHPTDQPPWTSHQAWAGARSDGDRRLPAPDGARMNIIDWAVSTMDSLGALGVALLILLEHLFPPLPSQRILPLAGVIAAGPEGSYLAMLLASVAGSVAGAWLLYGLGRLLGPKRLRRLFIRLPLIDVDDYD